MALHRFDSLLLSIVMIMCFGSYGSLLLMNIPDHAADGTTGKWGMNDVGDWLAAVATAVTSSFQV